MPETAPARKPWAVLAYTIAEDTHSSTLLDTTARGELEALCDAADLRKVSLAAQVDFKGRRGVYRGAVTRVQPKRRGFSDIDPKRFELWKQVEASVEAGEATVRLQRDPSDLNATDVDVLEEFLRFGRAECPADRYVVSFFGHAAGPLGLFEDRTPGSHTQDTMRLPALVRGFKGAGSRADVVIFRDCYMNCLETAYQLRNSTEFLVATQAMAPASGAWPWRAFMQKLGEGGSAYDVAFGVARALAEFLDDPANREDLEAVPYSLLDLSAAAGIVAPLTALTDALDAARQDPARRRAYARALEGSRVGSPQRGKLPGDPALLDVPTLCARLAKLEGQPVAEPAAALGRAVAGTLVRWHHSQTRHHKGTALFYKPVRPADLEESYLQATDETVAADDAAHYRALALSRATGWHRIALDPLPVDD
ncbi:MAG: clostripain-related cysteine peptidase [Vicinamibacterales bacterium]